jgi:hypothetical protein
MGIPAQIELVYVDRQTKKRLYDHDAYYRVEVIAETDETFVKKLTITDTKTHGHVLDVRFTCNKDEDLRIEESGARVWIQELEKALTDKRHDGAMTDGSVTFTPVEDLKFYTIDLTRNLGLIDFHVELSKHDVFICTDVSSTRPLDGFPLEQAIIYRFRNHRTDVRNIKPVVVAHGVIFSVQGTEEDVDGLRSSLLPFNYRIGNAERASLYLDPSTLNERRWEESFKSHWPVTDNPYQLEVKKRGGVVYYASRDGDIGFTLNPRVRAQVFSIVPDVIQGLYSTPQIVRDGFGEQWNNVLLQLLQTHEIIPTAMLLGKAMGMSEIIEDLEKGFNKLRFNI